LLVYYVLYYKQYTVYREPPPLRSQPCPYNSVTGRYSKPFQFTAHSSTAIFQITPFLLYPYLPSGLFPSGFLTHISYFPLVSVFRTSNSPIHPTYLTRTAKILMSRHIMNFLPFSVTCPSLPRHVRLQFVIHICPSIQQ